MEDLEFKKQVITALTMMSHLVQDINDRLDRVQDEVEGYSTKSRGSDEVKWMRDEIEKLGKLVYGDGYDGV